MISILEGSFVVRMLRKRVNEYGVVFAKTSVIETLEKYSGSENS